MENNKITVTKTNDAMKKVYEMVSKAKETFAVIKALEAIDNKTAFALINEQKLKYQYQMGYVLGALKANYDTLPEDIAARQKINNVPLNLLIKMKVDEFVLNVREVSNPNDLTNCTEYDDRYRRLSELICGFGYNMEFLEDRFELFFPNRTHKFVLGFAEGYAETFHKIAEEACVEVEYTDAKSQDIWKNLKFFLERDVHEYRLDGKYLFMYHGGHNCSADKSIKYGKDGRYVNENVYENLKSRKSSDFVDKTFNFNF